MYSNREFKYPTEVFWIKASVIDVLEDAEIAQLAGSSITAKDNTGADVSTTLLDQSTICLASTPDRDDSEDTALMIKIRGGSVAKQPYVVSFKVATTGGQLFLVQQQMTVKSE